MFGTHRWKHIDVRVVGHRCEWIAADRQEWKRLSEVIPAMLDFHGGFAVAAEQYVSGDVTYQRESRVWSCRRDAPLIESADVVFDVLRDDLFVFHERSGRSH